MEKWKGESAVASEKRDEVEFELTDNYQIGRITSPPVAARAGDVFTFAADVTTEFPTGVASYYRFWMSLEFLEDERVIHAASSGEIVGVQGSETLLAVTGVAPEGTTKVRAVLQAQNKYWNLLKNRAVARHLRLLKLSGGRGGALKLETTAPLPKSKEHRTATLAARGDWPNGTAVTIATTRGTSPRTALISQGSAEFTLQYTAEDVGSASVTASVADEAATAIVADPYAGVLRIDEILADGFATPALARLSQDGRMLPGRYQSSVPGIFIVPRYTVELAPGTWQLEISRGPQFEPFVRELQIASGKTEQLENIELRRRADLRRDGWYGGDADGDVYHGERIYTDVSAQTAADIAQAVGLDWVGVASWGIKPKNWAEARAYMRSLGSSQLLFMWTDEKPKTRQGHACFVGLLGPDTETLGWAWTGLNRPTDNFEVLQVIRAHGGATFVNHPLRWWMKGDRFNTNMYGSLPFDLCAAGALDGINVNEGADAIKLWSMLLDHGYRVAATAGADFTLDRPAGPLPGNARMYCFCPDGLSEAALSEAVRSSHTVISTGPVLQADIEGAPPGSTVSPTEKHNIRVRAWARGDRADPLKRLELWAHGKVLSEHPLDDGHSATAEFQWQPSGESDWVAVRAVSQRGWAMTSAFYADGDRWRPKRPLDCELTLKVQGLSPEQIAKSDVEVWDRAPSLPGAMQIQRLSLREATTLTVPVTATIVLRAAGMSAKEANVFDGLGVREIIDKIAAGEQREQPLLDWAVYQQVLDRCRSGTLEFRF